MKLNFIPHLDERRKIFNRHLRDIPSMNFLVKIGFISDFTHLDIMSELELSLFKDDVNVFQIIISNYNIDYVLLKEALENEEIRNIYPLNILSYLTDNEESIGIKVNYNKIFTFIDLNDRKILSLILRNHNLTEKLLKQGPKLSNFQKINLFTF